MGIFFDKTSEKNKVIYTRSRTQKRTGLEIMLIGFVLMVGFPFVGQFFPAIINSVPLPSVWPLYVFVLGGIIIIIDAILVSRINFALFLAKLKNKKFEIRSTNERDKVIIEQ